MVAVIGETPTHQLDECASSDDDKISFVDDEHNDNSVWRYHEITKIWKPHFIPSIKIPTNKDESSQKLQTILILEEKKSQSTQSTCSPLIRALSSSQLSLLALKQHLDKTVTCICFQLHSLATRSYSTSTCLPHSCLLFFRTPATPLKASLKEFRVWKC
ncbi:hypothetical protein HID58_057767 [Brassica napus]|uniref:Uncharacterized protein n=1 Tax=Brassica napus TaxID=3708 RepID=A0ABQ7XH29_BRANA|nr:hypothetical protein HID58_057767 [Brassica napus]